MLFMLFSGFLIVDTFRVLLRYHALLCALDISEEAKTGT